MSAKKTHKVPRKNAKVRKSYKSATKAKRPSKRQAALTAGRAVGLLVSLTALLFFVIGVVLELVTHFTELPVFVRSQANLFMSILAPLLGSFAFLVSSALFIRNVKIPGVNVISAILYISGGVIVFASTSYVIGFLIPSLLG